MKRITLHAAAATAAFGLAAGASAALTDGMEAGDPGLKSAGPIAFGPEGILFVSDPKGAAVAAFATGDTEATGGGSLGVADIGKKVAAAVGASEDDILIHDVAVNPASGAAYLSISRGRGPEGDPAIVRVAPGGKIEPVALAELKSSRVSLQDAPEDKVVGEGRRRGNKRLESITDLAYADNRVVIAGLSNEEFSSTLRTIEFPFAEGAIDATSVEIFHGAHGRLETSSPIRTFLPMAIDGEPNIVASYTCTPLVRIPMSELKESAHVKGTTVAELGNRNRPLDMIEYEKDGTRYILMANSARGVMKVDASGIGEAEPVTEKIDGTAGLSYDTVDAWQNVVQLDKLNDSEAVILKENENGSHDLEQVALP